MYVQNIVGGRYEYRKPTVKEAVAAKMKVLQEFYIVTDHNRDTIQKQLEDAIAAQPNRDYELVLDQVAHMLISQKL